VYQIAANKETEMSWEQVTTKSGKTYDLSKQEKTSSCGVASTMMVVKLTQNKKLDESTVRRDFLEAEGAINRDASGLREFEQTGATQEPIISVLAKYGVRANLVRGEDSVKKWVKKASAQKPVILYVEWGKKGADQGAHWVVCTEYSTNIVALDPVYGLVETPAADFPQYVVDPQTKGEITYLIQLA
jgi:ABC-type bacteriocin/lantibiotic exporter with double-glycine peptidase domain